VNKLMKRLARSQTKRKISWPFERLSASEGSVPWYPHVFFMYPVANSADPRNFTEQAVRDTDFGSANISRVTCLAVLRCSAIKFELALYPLCHGNSCIGDHQRLIKENIWAC
jgi:hypothetical protein